MLARVEPKYQIPPTRLPFVNGQIAQVRVRDVDFLVSAIWGGNFGGRLYFWNPDTHEHFMRELPKGVPGAFFLQSASDGRLYIGDGHGDLHRYDPRTDRFQTLVTGVMHNITWAGCVTDRYVVWSATAEAAVYDWREEKFVKKFSPVDESVPHAQYGHNVVWAPDGKVLIFMDVPVGRIVEVDLETMSARSVTPVSMAGISTTLAAHFLDPHTLVMASAGGGTMVKIVSYPKYELIADVRLPAGMGLGNYRGTFLNGYFYAVTAAPFGALVRLDIARRQWQMIQKDWAGDDLAYLGNYQNRKVAGVTIRGAALCYDPASNRTTSTELNNLGVLGAHAMTVSAEAGMIFGAPFINASFWTIDMKTGKGTDCGRGMPGTGQINQILWDAGRHRAVLASYSMAAVAEYDPIEPAHWLINPRLVGTVGHGQMRPEDLKFDRHFFWMATGPSYGQLGGAISRIDCGTNEIKVWRNIVPDQTPKAIVLDLKKHRVYFSTSIYADSDSTPPTQKTCEVVAFDMITLKVIKRQPLPAGTGAAAAVCQLPDGRVLLRMAQEFLTWDCDRGVIQHLGRLPAAVVSITQQANGRIWAALNGEIGRVTVGTDSLSFEPVIGMGGEGLQFSGGNLYWARQGGIYEMAVD